MILKHIKILILVIVLGINLPLLAKPNYSYTSNAKNYDYSGVYVDEKIDTPVAQIGISEEIFENQNEIGLEIVWNRWHANVYNKVAKKVYNSWKDVSTKIILGSSIANEPENFISLLTAKVNNDKTISNVITMIIPKESLYIEPSKVLITRDSKIYMYKSDTNKYYRWLYYGDPINLNVTNSSEDEKIIKTLLSDGGLVKQRKINVYSSAYLKKTAQKTLSLSGKDFLKFPEKSKRKYVKIFLGITDIDEIITISKATENMYNDVER